MRSLFKILSLLVFIGCGQGADTGTETNPVRAEMYERDDNRPVLLTEDEDTLPAEAEPELPFIGDDGQTDDQALDQTIDETENAGGEPVDPSAPMRGDEPPIGDSDADATHPIGDEPMEPMDDIDEFVFDPANERVVAQFEFNGDAVDVSGSSRDGLILGGEFVNTEFGQGLRVGHADHGFDWSRYSFFLSHPYTVEIVLNPDVASSTFSKLLGHDDGDEGGWYLYSEGFRTYPIQGGTLGSEMMPFGQRAYLAVVSTSDTEVHVFINGEQVTDEPVPSQYPRDPESAIFFRDDASPSRYETLHAVIDAMRISSVSRSAADIALVQSRLE